MDKVVIIDKECIKNIKELILKTAYKANIGHIPSSLSCTEILYVLYNKVANITKQNITNIDRDIVIISKEHCKLAQICVLAESGLMQKKYLDTYLQDDGILGHDMYGIVSDYDIKAIDVACSSLGHGPGVGVGLALGCQERTVFVLVGDGEFQEGSIWEAIMFAGHNKLKNLVLIVDRNYQQIDDFTKNIIDSSSNIINQVKSFGFDVFECDGHNIQNLEETLNIKTDKPRCIVANTIKGKDILALRDKKGFFFFHGRPLEKEEFDYAMNEVKSGSI